MSITKIVLVQEKGTKIRVLEGKGQIGSQTMAMRTRLTGQDIKYYALDFDSSLSMRLEAYIEALNMCPELLETSKMINQIVDL